jgi:hypothetical protein
MLLYFKNINICGSYTELDWMRRDTEVQIRNKGGANGALAPGAVHVGTQNV